MHVSYQECCKCGRGHAKLADLGVERVVAEVHLTLGHCVRHREKREVSIRHVVVQGPVAGCPSFVLFLQEASLKVHLWEDSHVTSASGGEGGPYQFKDIPNKELGQPKLVFILPDHFMGLAIGHPIYVHVNVSLVLPMKPQAMELKL